MFNHCVNLTEIDVSSWEVENVQTFKKMFKDCNSLKEIDLRKWKYSQESSWEWAFIGCEANLKLPNDKRFCI